MTVNAYSCGIRRHGTRRRSTRVPTATGSWNCQRNNLAVNFVFLTHTHTDHIYDLARLKKATKAKALVSKLEAVDDAETFDVGKSFKIGSLQVETRLTSGHSRGGTTYVIRGLEKPVAVVGDSLFCRFDGRRAWFLTKTR